jgi:DNA-binding transcriptional regulator YdaS (Cro superfamily)
MNALQIYLDQERGRAVQLASGLGVTAGAISQWERVPAERVIDVERLTGIPRAELRPDLYPEDQPRSGNEKSRKQKAGNKSIIGMFEGMVTLPPDFNPAEPFWELHDDWEESEIGGIENRK